MRASHTARVLMLGTSSDNGQMSRTLPTFAAFAITAYRLCLLPEVDAVTEAVNRADWCVWVRAPTMSDEYALSSRRVTGTRCGCDGSTKEWFS